jgi:hypothetical protein
VQYLWAVLIFACCFGAPAAESANPALYAGGVTGIADLLDPANSQTFRAAGGGLYLHNSGWATFTPAEQARVLQIFRGRPVAIEFGYGSGRAWGEVFEKHYATYGIKPTFIAVNAVKDPGFPPPDQWQAYSAALRAHGVPASTKILPIFLFENSQRNIATLPNNMVSSSAAFQNIVETGGGLVLDTPPQYVFAREPAYRDFIIDALRWTARHGLMSVVILSPHKAGTRWGEFTVRYVHYLYSHAAMPSVFVCENYKITTPSIYANVVGSDRVPYQALGNCELVRQKILPSLR